MKKLAFLFLFILPALHPAASQDVFRTWFTDTTMRVDYFHTGTSAEEHFSLDRVVNDGPWSGSKTMLLDDLNLGLYFFEVRDAVEGTPLYSRGFCSIFGEWQTIPEATTGRGTFHESIRFPWPKKPVTLIISKRDSRNAFKPVWQADIDPSSLIVNPAALKTGLKTWTLFENGPPDSKVDIVILGDGYTAAEMEKFHNDIVRLTSVLFSVEPFRSRKTDFNVRAVETPSAESGVNKPHPGVFRRTPLSMSYGAFDSERYMLGYDNRTIRDVASAVPYDFMYILANEQTYGGGGIHQLYATVSADNRFADYIFVHEFGHHMAGLADEYYTSAVSYEPAGVIVEPWEPNVTALKDKDNLRWKHLVEPGTPIPTPWDKEEYDKFSYEIQKERRQIRADKAPESVMEALFENERRQETDMISKMKYRDKAGAFEGAAYVQYGLYRSAIDCIMFSRNMTGFCPVCRETLGRVITQYSK
jgi:hypothetical protein